MKKFRSILALFLMMACGFVTVYAVEQARTVNFDCNELAPNDADATYGRFHPTVGTLTGYYDTASNEVSTVLSFKYDATAISNIQRYNNDMLYTGVDVKDCYDSGMPATGFDAYLIDTTLPNPVRDLERNGANEYNNEAEIVILGTLTANRSYTMSTLWTDCRQGLLDGNFIANAELSSAPTYSGGDYNSRAHKGLATLPYGRAAGNP